MFPLKTAEIQTFEEEEETLHTDDRETNCRGPSNYCTDGPLGRAAQQLKQQYWFRTYKLQYINLY